MEIQNENDNKCKINQYIKDYPDLTFIENEIVKQIGRKVKSYNLIYKPSRDGDKASDFHNKCDKVNKL